MQCTSDAQPGHRVRSEGPRGRRRPDPPVHHRRAQSHAAAPCEPRPSRRQAWELFRLHLETRWT